MIKVINSDDKIIAKIIDTGTEIWNEFKDEWKFEIWNKKNEDLKNKYVKTYWIQKECVFWRVEERYPFGLSLLNLYYHLGLFLASTKIISIPLISLDDYLPGFFVIWLSFLFQSEMILFSSCRSSLLSVIIFWFHLGP